MPTTCDTVTRKKIAGTARSTMTGADAEPSLGGFSTTAHSQFDWRTPRDERDDNTEYWVELTIDNIEIRDSVGGDE